MGAVPLRGRPHHRQYVGEEFWRMGITGLVAVRMMLTMKDRVRPGRVAEGGRLAAAPLPGRTGSGRPARVVATGAQREGAWGGRRNRTEGIRCTSYQAVQDGSRTYLRPSNTCIPRRIRRTGSCRRGKCSRHRDQRSARIVVQKAARACMARRDGRSAALHDSCRRRDRTALTRNLCPLCIRSC